MSVLFAEGVPEIFRDLPREAQRRAAHSIELISCFPRLMRGYRYFVAGRFIFYYSVAATEIRVTAIIPGVMRRA